MAKLLLIQTSFLTICWFAFVSGNGIEKPEKFKAFIRKNVAPIFHKWAENRKLKEKTNLGGEQFAVLMLIDRDKDWDTFEFSSPKPTTTYTSGFMVQPKQRTQMKNYVAVLPGSIREENDILHSEQRIYEQYLTYIWDKYVKKNGLPKAMVLYSWIVPCKKQSCPSKGTTGCTGHTINALKKYTEKTEVIIAYTTKGGGMSGNTKCNAEETESKLKKKGFKVIKVSVNLGEEQEAMMESLIKLGRLLQILE